MTTLTDLTHLKDADVRPDVRTETHSHRHRKPATVSKNPLWLLFVLLVFAIGVGGLFVVAYTLGTQAYAAVPVA